jgi:hypothetical protein
MPLLKWHERENRPTGEIQALGAFAATDRGQMAAKGIDLNIMRPANDRILGHGPADQPAIEPAEGNRPGTWPDLMAFRAGRALAQLGALWQGSARLAGALLGRFSNPGHAAVAQW